MPLSLSTRRVIVALFGCFYSVATPVVSIADARSEAEALSGSIVSHVEAEDNTQCPKVHPSACGLCQQITTPHLPAGAHESIAGEATAFSLVGGTSHLPASALWHATPPPRGPPVS